jgi:hypothetical protein
MSTKPEPLEVICDAPPYAIVRACWRIGLENPEDVRWLEINHFLEEKGQPPARKGFRWNELLLGPVASPLSCSCGRRLPFLNDYQFTFNNNTTAVYSFGQCVRCKTIYWQKG